MNKQMIRFSILISFLFFAVETLTAQDMTYQINGVVVDSENAGVPDLHVLLGDHSKAVTNSSGAFEFTNVPKGEYTLIVRGVGFSTIQQTLNVSKDILDLSYEIKPQAQNLEEITVHGKSNSYLTPISTIGSRVPILLKDNPQSIQVINQRIMQEQQAFTLNDAYKNAAGIVQVNTLNDYVIRGFRIGKNNFLVNGQSGSMYFENPPFLFNAERIEVLKGPAALTNGFAAPGGVVNFVTKKPEESKFAEFNLSGGSFNTYRFHTDVNTPISENILFRMNVGYEDAGSFVDFMENESFFVSPIVSAKFNKLSLSTEFTYLSDNRTSNYENGVPAYFDDLFAAPLSFAVHEPTDFSEKNSYQSQTNLKYSANEYLDFNLALNYNKVNGDAEYHITFDVPDTLGNVERGIEVLTQNHDFTSLSFFTNYKIAFNKVVNHFTIGADYINLHEDYPGYQLKAANPINIFRPIYGNVPDTATYYYDADFWYYKTKTIGFYIQDYISIGDKLNILLGLRYDDYDYQTSFEDSGTEYPDESQISAWIPKIGISYEPVNDLSIYASYLQGFEPQRSNLPDAGGPFPPEKGNQLELGVKSYLIKERLFATLAFYQITKTNVLTPDLNDPSGRLRVPTGEVESRGIELSLTGNITENFSVIGNYAYNNIEVTESNNQDEIGQRFGNTPEHLFNFWTTYKIPNGVFKNFKFGIGGNYVSDRIPYNRADLEMPSYWVLNGLLNYSMDRFSISLNVNNILNEEYYFGAFSPAFLRPGTPRNIRLGLGYRIEK